MRTDRCTSGRYDSTVAPSRLMQPQLGTVGIDWYRCHLDHAANQQAASEHFLNFLHVVAQNDGMTAAAPKQRPASRRASAQASFQPSRTPSRRRPCGCASPANTIGHNLSLGHAAAINASETTDKCRLEFRRSAAAKRCERLHFSRDDRQPPLIDRAQRPRDRSRRNSFKRRSPNSTMRSCGKRRPLRAPKTPSHAAHIMPNAPLSIPRM